MSIKLKKVVYLFLIISSCMSSVGVYASSSSSLAAESSAPLSSSVSAASSASAGVMASVTPPNESVHPSIASSIEGHFEEVTKNFYVGHMPQKDLRLVMERLTEENIRGWKHYAREQDHSRCYHNERSTGCGHFVEITFADCYRKCEVWVAYVTAELDPAPNNDRFYGYETRYRTAYDDRTVYPPTGGNMIKMFVAVLSSPNAKITSHQGISITEENLYAKPSIDGLSIPLHSFAAKVMLYRNPERRYMINPPVASMECIIAEKLRNGVFLGTKEMYEKRLRLPILFPAFKTKVLKGEMLEITEKLSDSDDSWSWIYAHMNYNEKLLGEKYVSDPFSYLYQSYRGNNFEEFLKTRTPIISWDRSRKYDPMNKVIIYNPANNEETWLEITQNDADYAWFFFNEILPQGDTHYIAIDLLALAQSCDSKKRVVPAAKAEVEKKEE